MMIEWYILEPLSDGMIGLKKLLNFGADVTQIVGTKFILC